MEIYRDKKWTSRLTSHSVFKNVQPDEAVRVLVEQNKDNSPTQRWRLLVTANGLLLNINDIEDYCKRTGINIQSITCRDQQHPTTRRQLFFVRLPFEFHTLNDPEVFRDFQRMLWLAGVHFHSCFDSGKWTADGNGLYNRDDSHIADLAELSRLHNGLVDAIQKKKINDEHIKKFGDDGGDGDGTLWQALTNLAKRNLAQIVTTDHHRQMPDILGIIRMLQMSGHAAIQSELCDQLQQNVDKYLGSGDPRRKLFHHLSKLPDGMQWDPEGHIPQAFDAYCRDIWMTKLGTGDTNGMKPYYSYNQATFPRADPGRFYEKFHNKKVGEIIAILEGVDREMGLYESPTFCLWHTAINYLHEDPDKAGFQRVSSRLAERVSNPKEGVIFDHGQLNFDAAQTLYFLGLAQSYCQRKGSEAIIYFEKALNVRRLSVNSLVWDPLTKIILEALVVAGGEKGDPRAGYWKRDLLYTYNVVMEDDRRNYLK